MSTPNPTTITTANQALAVIIPELSASGETPILDVDGTTTLTLRQAVSRVFSKITTILTLSQRPVSPPAGDDLYGHILSMRAEQLITQAIVADLASSMGRDVNTLIANAKASFS
jgi:hypothetical protein